VYCAGRAQGDRKTEKEKLEQALAIFTELKMPRERDKVQAELEKVDSGWFRRRADRKAKSGSLRSDWSPRSG